MKSTNNSNLSSSAFMLRNECGRSSANITSGTSCKSSIGQDIPKISFKSVPDGILRFDSDTLIKFSKDRDCVQLLINRFPQECTFERQQLFITVLQSSTFNELVNHPFGNQLIQKMVDMSTETELNWIGSMISSQMIKICTDSSGCRVVQKMIERVHVLYSSKLPLFIKALKGNECELATVQSGSHVIQKIFSCAPFEQYEFILKAFVRSESRLQTIVEDKYGCRVIQLALQKLREESNKRHSERVNEILDKIVGVMKQDPQRFISHQYANYIMQDLLCVEMHNLSNPIAKKDNIIIATILANLLSLSQEKHASHVVEKAFRVAPERILSAMMHEVFEGYESDGNGIDALHILMFDQYGNYVVQTMIDVALEVKKGIRKGKIEWFNQLVERVTILQSRLSNFSSGKRIILKLVEAGALQQIEGENTTFSYPLIPIKFR